MSRRRRNKNESLVEVLLQTPWQASVAIGVVVFLGMKWFLPALAGNNLLLKPLAQAFSGMSWLFSGAFFLIGAVAYLRSAAIKSKESAPAWRPNSAPVAEVKDCDAREPSIGNRQQLNAPIHKPTEWTVAVLRDIEWKRFEDLCQQVYETKGIKSETTALGPDGGIDIRLYQDDSGRPTSIVQCKAWGERYVGVKPVRELLGVMVHERIGKAFFMTSGYYSDDAKVFAQANRITLIDGDMLLMMIKRMPEADQQRLLEFATAGDYKTPTCPTCGIKMKRVPGKAGRPDFWGCFNYPRCRQKLGVRREA